MPPTHDDVRGWAAAGESQRMEYKATTGERREAARTLSAMLNGSGGMVLFGVTPSGKVIGQQVSDQTLEDVTAACRDIHPFFPPAIERVVVPDRAGHEVLVVTVPEGNAKPYAWKGGYYTRSGASTVDMAAEVELGLVLERAHGFDRWELATSQRELTAVDEAELHNFGREAADRGRAPFEAEATTREVLLALHLFAGDGTLNRAAIVLFASQSSLGGEYTMLACNMVAADSLSVGETFTDQELVEGNAFHILRRAEQFCREHLNQPVHIAGQQAEVGLEVPTLVLREALANAVGHRDYATPGAIQLRVLRDRVEVVSPGSLHFGLSAEDLYVPHGSYPWNPLVLAGLYRRGIVDQLGSGTLRMIRLCAAEGLGRPVFTATAAAVSCSIPRMGYWIRNDGTSVRVEGAEVAALRALADGKTGLAQVVRHLQMTESDTKRLLARLRQYGVAHPVGHGKGARWLLGPAPSPPVLDPD